MVRVFLSGGVNASLEVLVSDADANLIRDAMRRGDGVPVSCSGSVAGGTNAHLEINPRFVVAMERRQ
jgi:hypothetical protein